MKQASFRPTLERLETREVPATQLSTTAVTANLTAGVLTVVGSRYGDQMNVTQSGTYIGVQSVTAATRGRFSRYFATSQVRQIVVLGQQGDDAIAVVSTRPTIIFGGQGNDWLSVTGNNGAIYGGQGNDRMYGGSGHDTLYGGPGSDALSGGASSNYVNQASPYRTSGVNSLEKEVLRLVNVERARRGLAPLRLDGQLTAAARLESAAMATRSKQVGAAAALSHVQMGSTTPTLETRLDAVGYDQYRTVGENIAYGYRTPAQVVQGWMNSAGHRANILNPSYTSSGVAMAYGANGTVFWTQTFGAK